MVRTVVIGAGLLLSGAALVNAYSGAMSWYIAETGNAGACGNMLSNNGWTVALNYAQWDGGSHCGQQITISYGGQTQTVVVADRCESCGGYGGIDLTPGLADAFGMRNAGVVQATWNFGGQQQQQSPSTQQKQEQPTTSSSRSSWSQSRSSSRTSSTSTWSSSWTSSSSSSSTSSRPSSSSSSTSLSSSASTTSSNSTSSLATSSASNSTAAATAAVPPAQSPESHTGSLSQVNRFVIQIANVALQAARAGPTA